MVRAPARLVGIPHPALFCAALEVAAGVCEHFFVGFEGLEISAAAEAVDEFVEKEGEIAAARNVVFAQVANACGRLDDD